MESLSEEFSEEQDEPIGIAGPDFRLTGVQLCLLHSCVLDTCIQRVGEGLAKESITGSRETHPQQPKLPGELTATRGSFKSLPSPTTLLPTPILLIRLPLQCCYPHWVSGDSSLHDSGLDMGRTL